MQHRLMLFTFLFQFTGHGDVRHKKIKMDKKGWGRRQPSMPNRRHTWDSIGHQNSRLPRTFARHLSTQPFLAFNSHSSYLDDEK